MLKLLSKVGGQSSYVIPGCIQTDDMREQWRVEETNSELEGIFLLASLLSAVSDNRLSARTLLSTKHIYTLATAEEKGHEGLFVHGAMAIL